MLSTSEAVVEAPGIEAEDAVTVDWTEQAEAAVEQFEQPYISCSLGWDFGDIEAPVSNIEAEDAVTVDWTEEAEAAIEEYEQPYIFCTLGWGGFGELG